MSHPARCRARRPERCARWRSVLRLAALSAPERPVTHVRVVRGVLVAAGPAGRRRVRGSVAGAGAGDFAGANGLSRRPGWVTADGRVQGASAGLSACPRTDCHHLAVTGRYPVARAPWTGSWTGCRAHWVLSVLSVHFLVQSVQLVRSGRQAVPMVRRRSTVRFRKGAPGQTCKFEITDGPNCRFHGPGYGHAFPH
jgi:hypothetical protein